jgi:hypothetical protein
MKAKFKGTCAKTGAPINPGDEIRLDANRRAYLVDEDTAPVYRPRVTGPKPLHYVKGRGYV